MRKLKYVFAIGIGLVFVGCSSSASEDFDQINGQVAKKLIKSIEVTNKNNTNQTATSTFLYDSNNKLEKIVGTNNSESSTVDYSNNGTILDVNVVGQSPSESFNLEELYQSPYNAFDRGRVVDYDANKNPIKIIFNHEVYDYTNGTTMVKEYTAHLSYDDAPNPYFYTLEAAGLIEVMDRVSFNFSANPNAAEIVKVRALFPVNNLNRIEYKDEQGETEFTLNIAYEYDSDKYPIKGEGTGINKDGDIEVGIVKYQY